MKAAVYHGKEDIRVETVPEPAKSDDNMIAEILCCAICGTDLKTLTVGNPKFVPPIIIGHELVGRLVHVGRNVKGFKTEEFVTLATTIPCGKCAYCKMGLGNLCLHPKPISSYYNGAFAEYMEIPEDAIASGNVIRIPDDGGYAKYAISEPLSCAINAQRKMRISPGQSVAIVGGGPLGAIHAEYAKAQGAGRVFIVDLSKERLELMSRLKGITMIDGSARDVGGELRASTDGLGVDNLIVCAPAAAAFEEALSLVRKGGVVSFFASLPPAVSRIRLESRLIHYNELVVMGASDSRKEHVQEAVDLIHAGKIDTGAIITHSVALSEIDKGFDLMKAKKCLKVLVYPKGENR